MKLAAPAGYRTPLRAPARVAFTPKGGCPLKLVDVQQAMSIYRTVVPVAFTPKGGCPLKQDRDFCALVVDINDDVAFTPKGGCPLKP